MQNNTVEAWSMIPLTNASPEAAHPIANPGRRKLWDSAGSSGSSGSYCCILLSTEYTTLH